MADPYSKMRHILPIISVLILIMSEIVLSMHKLKLILNF